MKIRSIYARKKRYHAIRQYNFYVSIISLPFIFVASLIILLFGQLKLAGYGFLTFFVLLLIFTIIERYYKHKLFPDD